jgi:hypothetical protein
MVTSSSPTCGVIKMDDGEIPELVDFFKKTIVTEADRQTYHDLGWLSGNLISFIPEVDVPTVEGSTVLCFECQLAVGLGLPPSKFLSSVMSYLGCSLVHLNANVVSTLSSFTMLCECWLGIPPDTSLFWYYYLLPVKTHRGAVSQQHEEPRSPRCRRWSPATSELRPARLAHTRRDGSRACHLVCTWPGR